MNHREDLEFPHVLLFSLVALHNPPLGLGLSIEVFTVNIGVVLVIPAGLIVVGMNNNVRFIFFCRRRQLEVVIGTPLLHTETCRSKFSPAYPRHDAMLTHPHPHFLIFASAAILT